MVKPAIDFFCSFSLFAQRKEPKERAPVSLGPSGSLRALKSAGSFNTQFKLLIRHISGCSATCQWELNNSPFQWLPMPGPLDPNIYFSFNFSTFFHCFPLRLCLALLLNEYLFAIIITQLSIRLPLLAATEWGSMHAHTCPGRRSKKKAGQEISRGSRAIPIKVVRGT